MIFILSIVILQYLTTNRYNYHIRIRTPVSVLICILRDCTLKLILRALCNTVNCQTYVLVTTGKRTSAIIYHITFAIKYKLRKRLINGSPIKDELNYFSPSNFKWPIVFNRPKTNF